MLHRMQQVAPGLGIAGVGDVFHAALGDQPPAALAGAGADVDDVVRAAHRVFVMLHHHQGVALVAEASPARSAASRCRARAGRWSVRPARSTRPEVAAELRGQPDALGFATGERGHAAVQVR